MEERQIAYVTLALLLAASSVAAIESINLENENLYCDRYKISFWCPRGGLDILANVSPEDLQYFGYFNDFAFSDDLRYTGQLVVTSIDVKADLERTAKTEASYTILNPSSGSITVEAVALETPSGTELYVDGAFVDSDPLIDGWIMDFAPGEEKSVRLVFEEALFGNIYGYNINLLFDNKTVDNHICPLGTFKFTLPENSKVTECAPKGYSSKSAGTRPVISWTKTDFVPWTNPFNDLVCRWNMTSGAGTAATGNEEKVASGDNTLLILLLVIILLAGAFAAYKKGMLDGVLNR